MKFLNGADEVVTSTSFGWDTYTSAVYKCGEDFRNRYVGSIRSELKSSYAR
jgi:hypothetical protein